MDSILLRMPKLSKNDEGFFRGLGNKGLISFSEYLFLLTILIKPQVSDPCKKDRFKPDLIGQKQMKDDLKSGLYKERVLLVVGP